MMKNNVVLLPTDNRPVTYLFPQEICHLANLQIQVPPRNLMGSLFAPTDLSLLADWLNQAVLQEGTLALLLCLDTLLYGGLIPSRRSDDSLQTVLERAKKIAELKAKAGGKVKVYVQSSIMRISNNYDNTEEKLYWAEYGKEIFEWSQMSHQKELGLLEAQNDLQKVQAKIPDEVQKDYLATRARNFAVNQKLIDYVLSGDFDFLIFSQDDSGKFGFNVSEKNKLIALAETQGSDKVLAYAGADEMLMSLAARYLNDSQGKSPLTALHYSSPLGRKVFSNFEGQTIGKSLLHQASAQGLKVIDAEIDDEKIDFHIIVHTGKTEQGDHMWLPGLPDMRNIESAEAASEAIKLIDQAKKPVILCDVAYSNGSDPRLIDLLLARPKLLKKLWAYAGWNTTGNAVGSALAAGSACLNASCSAKGLDDHERKKLLFIRLLDDWAYQTQVRKEIQGKESTGQKLLLANLMDECAQKLSAALDFEPGCITYDLPWKRTFEIEIKLDSNLVKTV